MWTPEKIVALRKALGETQEIFAKRLRVALPTLRWWEQGQGDPSGPATVVFDQLAAELAKKEPVSA